jgi:hypothetical protein
VELDRIGQQLQLIYNLQKKASGFDSMITEIKDTIRIQF